MLDDLLKSISPDVLVHAIRSNPLVVQATLHKFVAYRAFGNALNETQQLNLSSNLNKLGDFFKSDAGKEVANLFGEEFITFCK
jgi:hypothetical protein